MTGFLRSIGFMSDEPSHVPAITKASSEAGTDLSLRVNASPGDGRDSEPEHLRACRERVFRAEVERDLAVTALILEEARYANQQRTWSAE